MLSALLFTSFLSLQTTQTPQFTQSVDLAATAAYLSFGDRTEFNGASRVACSVTVRRSGTGWFSATRILQGRHATNKQQFLVRVHPYGSQFLLSLSVASGPTSATPYVTWGLSDTPALREVLLGREHIKILWTFDHGRVVFYIRGNTYVADGTAPMPTKFDTVNGVDFRVGSTDLLQAQVGDVACWEGEIPDDITARALWCRQGICDLSTGLAMSPRGEPTPIPAPIWWSPLSGDLHPRVGSVEATAVPSVAFINQVPRSPVLNTADDSVASYRFEIRSGNEQGESRPHAGMPAVLSLGGYFLVAHSKGVEHLAANQGVVMIRSHDFGQTWPWPRGKVYPSGWETEETALETVESGRGSTLCHVRGGRLLHFINFRVVTPQPINSIFRYVWVRHSDNEGHTWSAWRNTVNAGTRFTSIGGGGTCVERDDGSIVIGAYKRNVRPENPDLEEGHYTAITIASADHGMTWSEDSIIADGRPTNTQWEEPEINVMSTPDGPVWAVLMRRDYPIPASIFSSMSYDEGHTWTTPTFAFQGKTWPVWTQLKCGPGSFCKEQDDSLILSLSQNPSTTHTTLRWSRDYMQTWSSGVDVALPIDGSSVGHSFTQLPDGRIAIVQSHEHPTTTGRARLEFTILRNVWE